MGYQNVSFPGNSLFLVTGGAGFIGSNLCEAILNLGYKVRCLDDLSTGKQANVDMLMDKSDAEHPMWNIEKILSGKPNKWNYIDNPWPWDKGGN